MNGDEQRQRESENGDVSERSVGMAGKIVMWSCWGLGWMIMAVSQGLGHSRYESKFSFTEFTEGLAYGLLATAAIFLVRGAANFLVGAELEKNKKESGE